jgi:hypothetical protein
MATFSEFLNSFDPDSKGKEFEHFVKWFLKNDPEWSKPNWGRLGWGIDEKHKKFGFCN